MTSVVQQAQARGADTSELLAAQMAQMQAMCSALAKGDLAAMAAAIAQPMPVPVVPVAAQAPSPTIQVDPAPPQVDSDQEDEKVEQNDEKQETENVDDSNEEPVEKCTVEIEEINEDEEDDAK